MHIQLQHSFFSPIKSGQERRMHALASDLLRRRYKVSVLVSEEGIDSVEQYAKSGIKLLVHPRFFSSGWKALFDPYFYTWRLERFLKSAYLHGRPDVVLSFNIHYAVATKRVSPDLPVGYLTGGAIRDWHSWLFEHHSWFKRLPLKITTQIAQQIEREALTKSERVFVEAKSIQRRLEENNPGVPARYVIWPTPVDRQRFRPCPAWKEEVRKELGIQAERVLLLCVGRLQWNKNFGAVIKALSVIHARKFQLVIVGEGPDRESLQQLAAAGGIGHQVRFLGARQNVERIYAAADIFLHPAMVEPYGNVVQEAMSSGLACIVSPREYIGFSEYLTDNVNVLFADPNDVATWVQRIGSMIDDEELRLRMGASARALIEARPDWEILTDALLGEFREIATSVS